MLPAPVNTGIIVVLMSFVVMPTCTRSIKRWLFG